MNRCVCVFLDESGNLDFSAHGTRYFVRTVERTWYDRIKPAVCSEVEMLHGEMEC